MAQGRAAFKPITTPRLLPRPGIPSDPAAAEPDANSRPETTSLDNPTKSAPFRANAALTPLPGLVELQRRYEKRCAQIDETAVMLEDRETGQLSVIPCKLTSRYRPEGQRSRAKSLYKRMSKNHEFGVFLTLTLPRPDTATVADAVALTREIWLKWKAFRDAINKRRARRGQPILRFLSALEFTKAGWPHMHLFFPGLKWLGPQRELQADWQGHIWICFAKGNAAGYVLKYTAKLAGTHNAILWEAGSKGYSASPKFYDLRRPDPTGRYDFRALVSAPWIADCNTLTGPRTALRAIQIASGEDPTLAAEWSQQCRSIWELERAARVDAYRETRPQPTPGQVSWK